MHLLASNQQLMCSDAKETREIVLNLTSCVAFSHALSMYVHQCGVGMARWYLSMAVRIRTHMGQSDCILVKPQTHIRVDSAKFRHMQYCLNFAHILVSQLPLQFSAVIKFWLCFSHSLWVDQSPAILLVRLAIFEITLGQRHSHSAHHMQHTHTHTHTGKLLI